MRYVKDAEANDMIHMGSDHRRVMATFLINLLGKDIHAKKKRKDMIRLGTMSTNKQKKNINIEMSELEERYQEIVDTKKAAARKANEVHGTRNNAKEQVKRENAAAAEAEAQQHSSKPTGCSSSA